MRADNLGEDRAVITGPGANMHDMCAIAQIGIPAQLMVGLTVLIRERDDAGNNG